MTTFELTYLGAAPFLLPLHRMVRRRLLQVGRFDHRPEVLDIGGRQSHYTIGIPGRITITDLPRESSVQRQLHLGVTPAMASKTIGRRSNVAAVVIDDMTRSSLHDGQFDYALAVEVLEHVEHDTAFVQEVYRVLKPGGAFLMTTPNGDAVVNRNPDHKRHYTREHLRHVLSAAFDRVEVEYAIVGGWSRTLGLRSWSLRHPARTGLSMAANVVNGALSADARIKEDAAHTRHLFAVAYKQAVSHQLSAAS